MAREVHRRSPVLSSPLLMSFRLLALLAVLPAAVQAQVARIVVTPATPTVAVHDTLRLRAEALDASGRPVPGVRVRFLAAGGRFEGSVDSTGLVQAGATGTLPVTAVAISCAAPRRRQTTEQLRTLRRRLPRGVALLVGGAGAPAAASKAGVIVMPDLETLDRWLHERAA